MTRQMCRSFALLSFVFTSFAIFSCHSAPTPDKQYLFKGGKLLDDETGNSVLVMSRLSDENNSTDCPSTLPGCIAIAEDAYQPARTQVDLTDADGLTVCTWMKFTSVDDYIGSHIAVALRRPGCRSWTCTFQTFSIRLDTFISAPWPNQLYSYAFPNDNWWDLPHPTDQLWRTFPYNFTDKIAVFPWNIISNGRPAEWNHLCWATDRSDIRMYVNGAPAMYGGGVLGNAKKTLDGIFSEERLEIVLSPPGREYWGGRQGLAFGDLQIFKTAIQPGHVQNIFEMDYMWPENICTLEEQAKCSSLAGCRKLNGTAECECVVGYQGDGLECSNIDECAIEDKVAVCHHLAYCDDTDGSYECTCPEGFLGDGFECQSDSWSLRAVFTFENISNIDVHQLKVDYARVVTGDAQDGSINITTQSPIVETASVRLNYIGNQITISALFPDQSLAEAARATVDTSTNWTTAVGAASIVDGPDVYKWSGRSTSDPYQVQASGFSLESVHFDPTCLASGCWVLEVTYSIGTEDFNVFYLPKAEASDQLSYDPDYSTPSVLWAQSAADSFAPNTHPCTSADYTPSMPLAASVSACCLPHFTSMYRPVASFQPSLPDLTVCTPGLPPWPRDRAVDRETVPVLDKYELKAPGAMGGKGVFVEGVFSGMDLSYGESAGVIDPFVGIYKAKFFLDETELRTRAGQLSGTVGVEHTVDTFLGLLNLSPTGTAVLDTFATQVAIHLEKTSFFSVATHGTNAYTLLEYVNMRLVATYIADTDFSGADERSNRTVRTDASNAAHYVQVTFTLGAKYEVNEQSGLVPLDSVRAGRGVFFDGAPMAHKCVEWEAGTLDRVREFNTTLGQDCAPATSMCVSPRSIPDSFISFNIPLGIDFFGSPSAALDNNVFVELVVSAVDSAARGSMTAPNSGEAPWQVKTTLSASIPVVDGGINVFCDGITAKTDLKDVATVDIIVGSAASADELSRLRILQDVASSQLDPQGGPTEINTASIESGLMTVVLKGDAGFFDLAGNAATSIELEDLITIHIMDSDGSSSSNSKVSTVMRLLSASSDDNGDSNGLDTDGYKLNDAFSFSIDRSTMRAHLDPTTRLLAECPFSPPRPRPGNTPLATCVTRRDVQLRGFPWRSGARSTAMEVCASPMPGTECEDCCSGLSYMVPGPDVASLDESRFFGTILGSSDFSHQLAIDFARAIDEQYGLNGRYRRAFWVNPGYEWTPTQTGGVPLFSLSQKLFLFALVTLDEGIASDAGKSITDLGFDSTGPNLVGRRRVLLSSGSEALSREDGGAVGSVGVSYAVTQRSMMAAAFHVPVEKVAAFDVDLQLTASHACLPTPQLQEQVRIVLDEYLAHSASAYTSVQITSLALNLGGEECNSRRRLTGRKLLEVYSSASVQVRMMIVFVDGKQPRFDQAAFAAMHGVNSIEPVGDISRVSIGALLFDDAAAETTEDDGIRIEFAVGIAASIAASILLFTLFFFLVRRAMMSGPERKDPERGFVQQSSARSFNKAELMIQCRVGIDWKDYQSKRSSQSLSAGQQDALASDALTEDTAKPGASGTGAAAPRPKTPKAVDVQALKAELAKDDHDQRPPEVHFFNADALKAELENDRL